MCNVCTPIAHIYFCAFYLFSTALLFSPYIEMTSHFNADSILSAILSKLGTHLAI